MGFVGIPTMIGIAKKNPNINIVGIDNNQQLLKQLNSGKVNIEEPYLEKELKLLLKKKKVSFSETLKIIDKEINVFIICVGTPLKKGKYSYLEISKIIKNILKLNKNTKKLIIIKSTILPDAIEMINKMINKTKNISLAINPEFLREGYAWKDFVNAEKIVIGYDNVKSKKYIKQIYKNFKGKIFLTNNYTACYIKQLSNAFFSSLISFSNSFALLADNNPKYKIDVITSFNALKSDQRFGKLSLPILNYINPGMGFGGYCLPKDISALSNFEKNSISSEFYKSIIKINDQMILMHLKNILKKIKYDQKIVILGLSFKPNSGDIRFSKSIELTDILLKKGYKKITLCDPSCIKLLKQRYQSSVKYIKKPTFMKDTHYILATAWSEYIKFSRKIPKKNLIDTRYLIN